MYTQGANKKKGRFVVGGALVVCIANAVHAMYIKMVQKPLAYKPTASLLYWPQGSMLPVGHCALAYTTSDNQDKVFDPGAFGDTIKDLSKVLATAQSGGKPLCRFVFNVSQEQSQCIERSVVQGYTRGATCAERALAPLIDADVCHVPAIVKSSPLLTAGYLTAGHKAGLNGVTSIKWYGPSSRVEMLQATLPGMTLEVSPFVAMGSALGYFAYAHKLKKYTL